MAVEEMKCCGALTRVYYDQGNRKHNPDCLMLFGYTYEEACENRGKKLGLDVCPGCGLRLTTKWSGVECAHCGYWECY